MPEDRRESCCTAARRAGSQTHLALLARLRSEGTRTRRYPTRPDSASPTARPRTRAVGIRRAPVGRAPVVTSGGQLARGCTCGSGRGRRDGRCMQASRKGGQLRSSSYLWKAGGAVMAMHAGGCRLSASRLYPSPISTHVRGAVERRLALRTIGPRAQTRHGVDGAVGRRVWRRRVGCDRRRGAAASGPSGNEET